MTSHLYFARAGDLLAPTDEDSAKFIHKLGDGEECSFKPLRPRSLQWHRLYWGLLSQTAPHLTEINISLGDVPAMMPIGSAEDLHVALKLITGHCLTQHIKGTPYVLRIPKPTDFSSMTADEWAAYYPKVLDAIHERALPQINITDLREELARMAS